MRVEKNAKSTRMAMTTHAVRIEFVTGAPKMLKSSSAGGWGVASAACAACDAPSCAKNPITPCSIAVY